MNQKLYIALSFYFYACEIRDSFEYCLPNKNFSIDKFNLVKRNLRRLLEQDKYFDDFVRRNGDDGKQVKNNLEKLYKTIYDSDYIRIVEGKITVDSTQNDKCIHLICGVKQTFSEICLLHLNSIRKDNAAAVDRKYFDLLNLESEFFGCVATLVIAGNLFMNKFVAFNKAINKTKGQRNAELDAIENEIKQMVEDASFVRSKTEGKGPHIANVVTAFSQGVDLVSGKTKLEVNADKRLEDNFIPIMQKIQHEIDLLQPEYRNFHTKIFKEISEYEKEVMKETNKR